MICGLFVETNFAIFRDETSNISPTLPITCPYDVGGIDGPGIDPGFLGSSGVDLSEVTSNFYKQYKAALALVPCDATALRVFTTDEIEGKEFTIGIIFVYDASVQSMNEWLE